VSRRAQPPRRAGMLRRQLDYIRSFARGSGDRPAHKGKRGRSGRAAKSYEAVAPPSSTKGPGSCRPRAAAAPATPPSSVGAAAAPAAAAVPSIETKLDAFEVLWPHHEQANPALARARKENRCSPVRFKGSHATLQVANITLDKGPQASPTSSDNTATEDSSIATEAEGCEGDDTCRDAAMENAGPNGLPVPRLVMLDAVSAQLTDEARDSSWQSASTRSSQQSTGRPRKKPPQGLPPSCMIDVTPTMPTFTKKPPQGLPPSCMIDVTPTMPMFPPRPASRRNSEAQLPSWSSPVFTPGSRRSSEAISADELALETQRRAEWVQDSALAV